MTEISTGTPQLLCELSNGVATLTFNRPEARNALSDVLSPALRKTIAMLSERTDVGAVLLTGAGRAFCAGGDVKGMGANGSSSLSGDDAVTRLRERQRTLTGALASMPMPTIAALPGPAVGAGLAIALACDIRIAARTAFVSTGYARIALTGDYGISWLLTRLVGTSRARELMYTAARVDAETCARWGLVNHVVDDDQLRGEARELAQALASGPRQAIRLMKTNLERALTDDLWTVMDREAAHIIESARSDDHKEGVRAFIEKRTPRFN